MTRRIVLLVAGGIAVLALLGFRNLDRIVLAVATPGVRFDPAAAPPAPDYADAASWSALPETDDAADAPVATLPASDRPEADVFYLHPTSYLGSAWNVSTADAAVNAATDAGATRIQASAFQGCCAVYAPRYRQANMTAFTTPSADAERAIALAAADASAAFRFYLERYDGGRPIVIAGHSQGAIVGARLLAEIAASPALRERIVAAYLIGSPLTEVQAASILPVCDSPRQTGCIVAFNARSADYVPGLELQPVDGRLCVNPLSWRHDEAAAPASDNRGAVFFEASGTPSPRPGFASARCEAGVLRVELFGVPPRDLPSRLLDHALGDGNYHAIEVGLFFVNLRENASQRVRAFAAARSGAP